MGAWKDLLDALKASVTGPIAFGGTIFPTSEGFPSMPAQVLKGGFYALETLEQLADIPYENLQLNMEVVVGAYDAHVKTKYFLAVLPSPGMKVSDIGGYVITDFWSIVQEAGVDPEAVPGPPGDNGWSAVFGTEADGPNREVEVFIGWIGGTGSTPATPSPLYKGPGGFVSKALATNIKGNQGPAGTDTVGRPEAYFSVGVREQHPPNTNYPYVSPSTFAYVSLPLIVTNTHTVARRFKVFGEVPVANTNGDASWSVGLISRTNATWPAIAGDNATNLDETYSRQDFVNVAAQPSVHKITVQAVISLAAGESRYIRLIMAHTHGNNSKYEQGFIEAFGL